MEALTMIKLASHKFANISAPADDVWEVIADFGAIERWWPAGLLSNVEIEGAGIGMVRALHTTIGIVLRERLDALYPDEHRIELSISGDLPVGITDYTAAGAIMPWDMAVGRMGPCIPTRVCSQVAADFDRR